ncbi:MAG: hypothetical protein ACE366_09835 [Bradymonadia bacterium]
MSHTGRIWRTAALLAALAMGCDSESENNQVDPPDAGGAGGAAGEGGEGGAGGVAGGPGGAGGEVGGAGGEAPVETACNDGVDNDDDGAIDYPDDPGCDAPRDDDETDPVPPACDDGLDNDTDGFTDFPEDPGCGSPLDNDETNPPPMPQCSDGLDNDQDGLVDELDPGCASVADPRENDPEEAPQCSDSLDNDGDGVIDFPYDLGCTAAGDDDEMSPENPPGCADGVDNDADGFVDFPNDPGCIGVGDRDETDRGRTPDCADNRDNDNDGQIDYPNDPGCYAAGDYSEQGTCGEAYNPPTLSDGQSLTIDTSRGVFGTAGSCGGQGSPEVVVFYRLERDVESLRISTANPGTVVPTTVYVRRLDCLDGAAEVVCSREAVDQESFGQTITLNNLDRGEYYIFLDGVDGRGGDVEILVEEVPLAQCLNGIDDDGDGNIDYPEDPGCERPDDRDEFDEGEFPICSDGLDNDGDGVADFPLDPGCVSAADVSEDDICGAGVRFQEIFLDPGSIQGNLGDGASNARGSCGGANQPELVYYYYNPYSARLTFSTDHPETEANTILYVRSECDRVASELACSEGAEDEEGNIARAEVTIDSATVGGYFIFVDSRFGDGAPFKLTVEAERLPAGCANGFDDDGDALIDGEDPGCESLVDEDERDPVPAIITACDNGRDDDGDGYADFPFDPGCVAVGDDDETDPEEVSQCSDGIDNDEDGVTDFPDDAGCSSRSDTIEDDPRPTPQCANRLDDDQDGLTDYPFDPGCYAAGDRGEADPELLPACANELDDDRDGIADFPFDPGCTAAGDDDETDPPEGELPVCSDGEDNDEDGITDFPLDPGCRWAADPDEEDPRFAPACGNGNDDDGDGRPDFPDDPGCRYAADTSEENEGVLPVRCADGVDNDFDGLIDLRDFGCEDNEDDDETDPDVLPVCGNEIDDDEDLLTDWPDDPGCQAAGDLSEDQSCRPEVDTPLIPVNGTVMGATVEGDPDRYNNRCGGRQAPEAVYRYVLEEAATLRISAANEGTDYAPVISVSTDCEEPGAMVACAGNFANPEPTLLLPDAEPGEYFIFIDGGGPEQWVSAGGNIVMPADPRNFQARNDIQAAGWSDGGNDAFDGYGRITITHNGAASGQLDVSLGQRNAQAGGYGFTIDSSQPHPNVWRIRLEPTVEFDERLVDFVLTGNLGSDGSTQSAQLTAEFNGRDLAYMRTADGPIANGNAQPRSDPPVLHMLVPSDPEQVGQVDYGIDRDNVTITANGMKLPLTMYVALSYVEAPGPVVNAVLTDVELRAGPGGEDAPRFGNFELSVTELPAE